MSTILNTLKEKFSDIYELLSKNSVENNLIFFVPNARFYSVESLNDRAFYYSHIFKKSNYNPDLYVNFLGKVMKSVDKKKFVTELGFKNKFELNVKNSYINDDNIISLATDGLCIDGENNMDVVETEKEKNNEFEFKRCSDSKEYIEYYSNEELTKEKYKKYIKGKINLDKFIYAMKNNNILMKENEDAYGMVFSNSVSKLITYFSAIFINFSETSNPSEKEQLKIAASEFVDSFIFKELYDDIMEKFKDFYKEEESQLKKKLEENKSKYNIDILKLPNSIEKCKFNSINKNLSKLSSYKTYFEKKKSLTEINVQIIKEFDDTYKEVTGKDYEKSADFMISFWMYIIANFSKVDNLISESLFLETFNIQNEKGQDEVIVNSFIVAVNTIKNEMLRSEKDINVFMVKPFVVTTQE